MKLLGPEKQKQLRGKHQRLHSIMSKENWEAGRFYRFDKGEFLFQEGDASSALYLLAEGECRVSKTVESGKTFLISHYGGVSVIGEVELFEGKEYQSAVQMLGRGVCFVLRLPERREAILNDLSFMRFIARQLCTKVERSDRNSSINLSYLLKERLSSYILYAQRGGVFASNHTHLANHLGCSHRHLLRTLGVLCERGVLEKGEHGYRILDEKALQALAGDAFYVSQVKI